MSANSKFELGQISTGAPIPFVRASAFAPFVGFLSTLGSPVERWLQQARVPADAMDDPETLVPIVSGYRFIEFAARREQIDGFGVVIGQRTSSFDLGAYGAALKGASTVYEYLRLGARLLGEHSSGTSIWLAPERKVLRVNQYLKGPACPGRFTADLFTLAISISMMRRFLGPTWSPGEVRLMAGTERFLGRHDLFGDAEVVTGQRHTSFTISRELLQLSLPGCHAESSRIYSGNFADRPDMPDDFKSSIEQLVVSLMSDGCPSIQVAAEVAGLSSRTLQRRLATAGTSYSELVSAGRLRVAKLWLAESTMPVAEIAALLGYKEPTNFARAFRQLTGVAPLAYRRMRKAG